MFYAHALREKRGIPVMHDHTTLTTFTRFAGTSTCSGIVWHYHACNYTVGHVATLQSYLQPVFLAQQWCILKSKLFSVQHC